MTVKAAVSIYQSMLLPLFTYCSIVTCQTNNTYKEKVKSLEHRARKIIFKNQPTSSELLTVYHLMQKICTNVFKCLNGDSCKFFENYFDVMRNATRNNGKLIRIPKFKLEGTKKSFRYYGAKCFNDLPFKARSAETFKEFLSFFD